MEQVTIEDKQFKLYLDRHTIHRRIGELATRIDADRDSEKLLCLAVLNGAFMFAADLIRAFQGQTQISFIKVASYEGFFSTGDVRELIGLSENIAGRHVLIIEDIVDSGNTLEALIDRLREKHPASIRIATLLLKPDNFSGSFPIDYVGFEIPNDFVIGYGLDYNGFGRGLDGIYSLVGTEG